MTSIESWLDSVLGQISNIERCNFAGLGLVVYTDRQSLPVHPLAPSNNNLALPTTSLKESIELLKAITLKTSEYHDGFHLVDAETLQITDVSQFLSPTIPPKPIVIESIVGARQMAARLASMLHGVQLTITYTLGNTATIYEAGVARTIDVPASWATSDRGQLDR